MPTLPRLLSHRNLHPQPQSQHHHPIPNYPGIQPPWHVAPLQAHPVAHPNVSRTRPVRPPHGDMFRKTCCLLTFSPQKTLGFDHGKTPKTLVIYDGYFVHLYTKVPKSWETLPYIWGAFFYFFWIQILLEGFPNIPIQPPSNIEFPANAV